MPWEEDLTGCAEFESRERRIIKSRYKPDSAFRLTFRQKRDGTVEERRLLRGHLLDYVPPEISVQIIPFDVDGFPIVSSIPFDNRVQLAFDLPWLWEYEQCRIRWKEHITDDQNRVREKLLDRMHALETFDRMLRKDGDGDFCIMDNMGGSGQVYRGHDNRDYVIVDPRENPNVSGDEVFLAPWQRLIFCKDLSTVAKPDRPLFENGQFIALPYIALDDVKLFEDLQFLARGPTSDAITEAVKLHNKMAKSLIK